MQGLLLINKPKDITSFSAVARVRRIASERRTGHTGTLDPMATGVLPVFLGRATTLSSYLLDADKQYIAGVKLGITTDTEDITGNVLSQKEFNITSEQLLEVFKSFTGKIKQVPPMYSALKRDGVPLYKFARQGKSVELDAREINISSIELVEDINENGEFKIKVDCSKGTYIRSLCRDIGNSLGCGATLCSLVRTKTGGFSLEECIDLDAVNEENISQMVISEENAVKHFMLCEVTEKQAVRFSNGGELSLERLKVKNLQDNQILRVKFGKIFLGLGQVSLEKQHMKIKCIVNQYTKK